MKNSSLTYRNPAQQQSSYPHRLFVLIYAGLLLALLLSAGCSKKGANPAASGKGGWGAAAIPVTVATVEEATMPLEINVIGNVVPYSTVSIKAQVTGELLSVHFKEGDDVKQGQLLFRIDARPYEATLQQAKANLGRDEAQLKQAQANLERDVAQAQLSEKRAKRYSDLNTQGIVAKDVAEQYQTGYDASAASVNADRAAIENAEAAIRADKAAIVNAQIQLDYCSIKAPISGRTGNLGVRPGNLVKANDNPVLVVINQTNPIFVAFSVPEQQLALIKKYMEQHQLKVLATPAGSQSSPEEGVLNFVDNSVDQTTGTIQLKGEFPNEHKALWPGLFVNVALWLAEQPHAIVVPSQAVQTGQQGQYAYLVNSEKKAELRNVTVDRIMGAQTVIASGLKPGDTIVTDGHLLLKPGAVVEIKTPESEKATPGRREKQK